MKFVDVPLEVPVKGYIGHLECTFSGTPRTSHMYRIILYRNMYLYRAVQACVLMVQARFAQFTVTEPFTSTHETASNKSVNDGHCNFGSRAKHAKHVSQVQCLSQWQEDKNLNHAM
jgi:hypothetical protein